MDLVVWGGGECLRCRKWEKTEREIGISVLVVWSALQCPPVNLLMPLGPDGLRAGTTAGGQEHSLMECQGMHLVKNIHHLLESQGPASLSLALKQKVTRSFSWRWGWPCQQGGGKDDDYNHCKTRLPRRSSVGKLSLAVSWRQASQRKRMCY